MEEGAMTARRRMPRWAWLPIGLLVLVVGWVIADAVGRHRVRQARERWTATVGPLPDARSLPRGAMNDAAKRAERLALDLGFDLRVSEKRARPAGRPSQALLGHIRLYLDDNITRPGGAATPPPPELAAWLGARRPALEALADELLRGDVPQWSRSLAPEELDAGLLGHLRIQNALAAAALERAAAGDDASARRLVEAAWRLNDSLADDEQSMSQILGIVNARQAVGLLRKLRDVPAEWEARIVERDWNASVRRAVEADAALWMLYSEERGGAVTSTGTWLRARWDHEGLPARLATFVTRPLACATTARDVETLRAFVLAHPGGRPCHVTWSAASGPTPPSLAEDLRALGYRQPASVFVRAQRLALDAELTRHVLRARRLHEPGTAPGACPDWTFVTEVDGAGLAHVRVDGVPAGTAPGALVLPLAWHEPAPP